MMSFAIICNPKSNCLPENHSHIKKLPQSSPTYARSHHHILFARTCLGIVPKAKKQKRGRAKKAFQLRRSETAFGTRFGRIFEGVRLAIQDHHR